MKTDENLMMLEDRHKILEANIETLLEEIHLLKSEEQQVEQLRSEHLDEQNRSEWSSLANAVGQCKGSKFR